MSVFLGIDVGTSGTKTLAMDEKGKILGEASQGYPCYYPEPLWSEQDPEDWWRATVGTIQAVVKKAKLKAADVKAIGLSGQMHGSVFLDKSGKVIRRALLWNDQRTEKECEEIYERVGGRKKLIQLVANPALTGFTAPKILWLRNHEPKNFDKLAKVLLPKDEIRRRLTGEMATDVSDASGMLLLDVAKRNSSKKLLEKLELDASLLATCYESEQVTGKLTPAVAKQLGAFDRVRGGGRGGRLCRQRRGHGSGDTRHAFDLNRHQRRDVCALRRDAGRSAGPAAHVLPRRTRQMGHDGCEPERGGLAAMVCRTGLQRPRRHGKAQPLRRAER